MNPGYKVTVIDGSTTGFYNKGSNVTVTSITKPTTYTENLSWQGQTAEVIGNIKYQTRTTYTYKNGQTKTITNLQAPQAITMGYKTEVIQINKMQYQANAVETTDLHGHAETDPDHSNRWVECRGCGETWHGSKATKDRVAEYHHCYGAGWVSISG